MAEKFQAIVALGAVNGRMKDYYDLYAIPRAISVTHGDLKAAIEATSALRQTDIPATVPPDAFSGDVVLILFVYNQ